MDQLPIEEQEVVGLTFYNGWTQAQIADLFGVDERTPIQEVANMMITGRIHRDQ